MPTILVCHTDECDKKLGGKGARSLAYHYFFIHISPKGINETIVAYELVHVELHKKLGIWRKYNGDFPTWFDEGLQVSNIEKRYHMKKGSMRRQHVLFCIGLMRMGVRGDCL